MNDAARPRCARGLRVLILSASTGAGHDSVAAALREALHRLAPDARVRIYDPLSGDRRGLLSPGRLYDATVAHAPWAWGLFFQASNGEGRVRLGMAAGSLVWVGRLRAAIRAEQPHIVVAAHPLCARLAAHVMRAIPAAPPLHCVVTDLIAVHHCWASTGVDTFYVATTEAAQALIAAGISAERVRVTGLPLRASFARAASPLPASAIPRVLVLEGGRPSRRIERVARALVTSRMPMHLVVVCGRNERLRRRLARELGAYACVLGWRDDVAALMRSCDVVVTKAGSATVAEALSLARPVLIYHALPGQEDGTAAFVERDGHGRYVPDVTMLAGAIATVCGHGRTVGCAVQPVAQDVAARVAAHVLAAIEPLAVKMLPE